MLSLRENNSNQGSMDTYRDSVLLDSDVRPGETVLGTYKTGDNHMAYLMEPSKIDTFEKVPF